jgi:hypothetical protein
MKPDMQAPAAMPSMKMDAPLASGMARPGTPMMDVPMAAAVKEDCMKPMLEHEQRMMEPPQGGSR